jgi:hypothetical protein
MILTDQHTGAGHQWQQASDYRYHVKREDAEREAFENNWLLNRRAGRDSSIIDRVIILLVLAVFLSACSPGGWAGDPGETGGATAIPLSTPAAEPSAQDALKSTRQATKSQPTATIPGIDPAPSTTPIPTATLSAELASAQTGNSDNPVLEIPLAGPVADRQSELSGLAWYGDYLIFLPQYPYFARDQSGSFLYVLSRAEVLAFLDGQQDQPLTPRPIPFITSGLERSIPGFEGYEAIAFSGEDAYVTIEARNDGEMLGYLIKGTMAPGLEALTLDPSTVAVISPQTDALNISEESLFVSDRLVGVIHELNGLKVNPTPVVHLFEHDLTPAGTIPFPNVPFRITDATTLDAADRFWTINYLYPESSELLDLLKGQEDEAKDDQSWPAWTGMGRLLEFQFTSTGITPTGAAPIQLENGLSDARNWEGLTRLDNRGFLLVSDKIPGTALGFVPLRVAE